MDHCDIDLLLDASPSIKARITGTSNMWHSGANVLCRPIISWTKAKRPEYDEKSFLMALLRGFSLQENSLHEIRFSFRWQKFWLRGFYALVSFRCSDEYSRKTRIKPKWIICHKSLDRPEKLFFIKNILKVFLHEPKKRTAKAFSLPMQNGLLKKLFAFTCTFENISRKQ